jgi:hypothetical protein
MTRATDLDARRALLVAQCELDRIELALAWHDVRRAVGGDPLRGPRSHPWVGRALGMVIPLLGATRARNVSRYLSFAVLAYRIVTGWHTRGR